MREKHLSIEHRKNMSKAHMGHLTSIITRQKISEGNKGKSVSQECRDRIARGMKKYRQLHPPANKNKKMSEEFRRKNSLGHLGEKSYLWKGGITSKNFKIRQNIEFRLWREAVFARDNWTCQKCKKRGIKLHPHHIQNFAQYPDLRFAIDNGVTLGEDCHRLFHRIYGFKNNTTWQIEKFIKNKQEDF